MTSDQDPTKNRTHYYIEHWNKYTSNLISITHKLICYSSRQKQWWNFQCLRLELLMSCTQADVYLTDHEQTGWQSIKIVCIEMKNMTLFIVFHKLNSIYINMISHWSVASDDDTKFLFSLDILCFWFNLTGPNDWPLFLNPGKLFPITVPPQN